MTPRLSPTTELPPGVRRPGYDRARIGTGLVHLGIGAFHRAHQATFTEDVLEQAGGDWGILGVSLRSPAVRDQLMPQGGLYTVVERGPEASPPRLVGAVRGVLVGPEDPGAVVAAIAAPGTAVISLTITEKGYCHDPATGDLDPSHPDIRHDLEHPDRPRSALGYLSAGLRTRWQRGLPAPTLLCCDNLRENGVLLSRVLGGFARLRSPSFADWVERNVAFPSSMVDRIVPATTPADLEELEGLLGVRDDGAVVTEPFRQWVVEDRFAGPRPAWELAGAQLVRDVRPFETAKLRLLNGSHSTLAYLGLMAGHAHVHEAVAEPGLRALIRHLMVHEVTPTLTATPGMDLAAYGDSLMVRFANPTLRHRLRQIAMDGSQKLPERLLAPMRDRLAAGAPVRGLALAVAAWVRYCLAASADGAPFTLEDPLASRIVAMASTGGGDPGVLLDRFLSLRSVFGDDLPRHPGFRSPVLAALHALLDRGVATACAEFAQDDR